MTDLYDQAMKDLAALFDDKPSEPAPQPIVIAPPTPPVTNLVIGAPKIDLGVKTQMEAFTDEHARDGKQGEGTKFPTFTEADVAETLDIRNFATMARLRVRKWHARIKDKRVAHDASVANGASDAAFSVYKRLLAGAEDSLKKVHAIIDSARLRHYQLTLPWSTTGVDESGRRDGPRLLPNTLFMEYVKEMGEAKTSMKASLAAFIQSYPAMMHEARRQLGKSYDETEYPPVSQIEDRFALDFDFQPIPTGVDFKGLPKQQCEALARTLNGNVRKCLENAMRDVWQRLHTAVLAMAERLGDPKKIFHDTLITNLRELVALLAHLNATDSPELERLRARVATDLCAEEPDTLRENMALRALVADNAVQILRTMERIGYGGQA